MSQLPIFVVASALLAALAAGVATDSSSANGVLQRVMVVHRHGARTALLECSNPSCEALIPPEGPGVLTVEGKLMLFQLGRHLRRRYDTVLPKSYNPRHLYSRAADEDRTIQSGIAMLRGLYCNDFNQSLNGDSTSCTSSAFGSVLYPTVHTMQKHEDLYLDPWGGMAILGLRYHVGEPAKYAFMNNLVQSVWSNTTMQRLALETGFGSECPEIPYDCLGDAVDFAKYAQSRGILEEQFPLLNKLLDQANWLWTVGNNYTYHGPLFHPNREPSNVTGRQSMSDNSSMRPVTGNVGYPLAKELARNARGVVKATDDSSFNAGTNIPHTFDQDPGLVHYSGHDVTLIPLTSALGNDTVAINPPFGAALVIEVWNASTSTLNSSTLFVKAEYGIPADPSLNTSSSTFSNNFGYRMEPYKLWCMTQTGAVYGSIGTEGDVGCPLEDWERFIDVHSAPSHLLQVAFGGKTTSSTAATSVPSSASATVELDFNLAVGSTVYCTAFNGDLEAIGCLPHRDPGLEVVPGSRCWIYRRRCPLMACAYVAPTSGELVSTGHLQMNLTCL